MKKLFILFTIFVFTMIIFCPYVFAAGEKEAKKKVLSIMTWEGYLPDSLVNEFEEKFGYEVKLSFVSNNGEIISKLKASGMKGFDLAQNDIDNIPEAMADGIYQALDVSKLKNYNIINPSIREGAERIATINGKLYAVPYCWGTTGVVANVEKAPEVNSFMDLFSDKYCGKVSYRATRNAMIAAALALGIESVRDYSIFKSEEETRRVWDIVTPFMIDAKKCVKTYWTSEQQLKDLFITGGVVIAEGWDYTAWSLASEGYPIKFIAPKEGCLAWIGGWEIPLNAADVEGAYKFIDFFWEPQNQACIFSEGGVLTVSKDADKYMSEQDRKKIAETYPQEAIANMWWYPGYPKWWVTVTAEYETKIKTAVSK